MTAPKQTLAEAVAEAVMKLNGCGLNIGGRQMLCYSESAKQEGVDSYGDAFYRNDCECMANAQTAISACHAAELIEALQILASAVKQDLSFFPDQPHKDSALGRAEAVLAKLGVVP